MAVCNRNEGGGLNTLKNLREWSQMIDGGRLKYRGGTNNYKMQRGGVSW